MKKSIIFFLIACVFFANPDAKARITAATASSYVVIGAFSIEKNAKKFVENARKLKFEAISEINPNRNLFYVYVLQTSDLKAAFDEANKIRKETSYWDTWVYTGLLGKGTAGIGQDVNPATETAIVKVEVLDVRLTTDKDHSGGNAITAKDTAATQNTVVTESVDPSKPLPVPDAVEGGKNFVFRIFTGVDKKELAGDIDVMDKERSRKLASFKGNQNVVVKSMNKTGNLSLICEVFGYRTVQLDMNYNKPEDTQGTVTEGNQIVVPFDLARLKKGDVTVMYSVYFFNDAAIMRPESRSEVTSLMEMMQENPKYKIRIHGHTNGGAPGKIISMGESKKFFALDGTKDGFGSAKKLSEERAKVMREFLIAGGIEANRMEIKAWGGKKPIADKLSAQARSNVRVEIEILEDK